MQASISIKELRSHLSKILAEVQKGRTYALIYHSRVVAELGPVKTAKPDASEDHPLNIFIEDHPEFAKWKPRKSAVQLVREVRD